MNSLEPTDRRRWAALGAHCTSLVVVTIDNTILNTAIPTLARDLRATTVDLQWITNAYTLAFAALLITAGGLGARFGHRRILLTGLTLFALGVSLRCPLSHVVAADRLENSDGGSRRTGHAGDAVNLSSRCSPRTMERPGDRNLVCNRRTGNRDRAP